MGRVGVPSFWGRAIAIPSVGKAIILGTVGGLDRRIQTPLDAEAGSLKSGQRADRKLASLRRAAQTRGCCTSSVT